MTYHAHMREDASIHTYIDTYTDTQTQTHNIYIYMRGMMDRYVCVFVRVCLS